MPLANLRGSGKRATSARQVLTTTTTGSSPVDDKLISLRARQAAANDSVRWGAN